MKLPSIKSVVVVAGLFLCIGGARGAQIEWTLVDPACTDGQSTVEIACGNYGTFHFIDATIPPNCDVIEDGSEEPAVYGQPSHLFGPFPGAVQLLDEIFLAQPPGNRSSSSPSRTQDGSARNRPWIVAIDFDSLHGISTSWLTGEIAGENIDTFLLQLDREDRDPLGAEVNDFHVLASLCDVADLVDKGRYHAPIGVGMSFGRAVNGEDPSAENCNAETASCQIAGVIAHIREFGTNFSGAAGNHREMLFPAYLNDVVAVGMLDMNPFLYRDRVQAAWETPREAISWMPGNGLCLRSWAAPAGASYSSAILVGWIAKVLQQDPAVDPTRSGPWVPAWDAAQECFVLANGRELTPWCNDAITELFAGLAGGSATTCWGETGVTTGAAPSAGEAEQPVEFPSLDDWLAETHPTPESDPCVPCVGIVEAVPGTSDLVVDFSQSTGLDTGVYLDSVSLRVAANLYPLHLTGAELAQIENGTLVELRILSGGPYAGPGARLSLSYLMKDDPLEDCLSSQSKCYWTSDPILLTGLLP